MKANDNIDIECYEALTEGYIEDLANEYDGIDETQVTSSDRLDEWIVDYTSRRKGYKSLRSQKIQKVAGLLLVLCLLSVTIVNNVEAVRVRMGNLFISDHDQYTKISYEERNVTLDEVSDQWEGTYALGYLPQGLVLDSINNAAMLKSIRLSCADQRLSYMESPINATIVLDTEDAEVTNISIKDHDVMKIVKGDAVTLFFSDEKQHYTLLGYHIEVAKMIKVVESMSKVD